MHTKVARTCGKKGDIDCAKAYVRLVGMEGQLLSAGGRRAGRTCVCQKVTVSEQPQLDETENSQNLQQCI